MIQRDVFRMTYIVFVIFLTFVTFGNIQGFICFGLGLGDVMFLVGSVSLIILSSLLRWRLYKRIRNEDKKVFGVVFSVIMIALVVVFLLKFTFYRATECPWDGRVFIFN